MLTWLRDQRRVLVLGAGAILIAVVAFTAGATLAERSHADDEEVAATEAPTVAAPSSDQPQAEPQGVDAVGQTASGTTTPTPVPATQMPATLGPVSAQFVETFDDNTGLERFRTGLYFRDNVLVAQDSWPGDHDLACGPPSTSRTIHRDAPDEFLYLCKDHLMTAIGDTSGYSVGWFSPDQVFDSVTEVCWDVNLTNLGSRQWWKVAVLSVDAPDIMSDQQASSLSGIEGPDRAVASWSGGGGWEGKLRIGGDSKNGPGLHAGSDKMTRYPGCFRDNQDGTLTMTMTGPVMAGDVSTESFTVPGSFPSGALKVVFQDHSYTPTKDDNHVGGRSLTDFTWHWDNIIVR